MARPNIANNYTTTLNGAITNVATSCVVTVAPPAELVVPFKLRLVAEGANTNEIVTVTAVSSTTLTIARATEIWNGVSTASAHADGTGVEHNFTAGTLTDAWALGTGFIGASVYATATTSINNTTFTAVAFGGE